VIDLKEGALSGLEGIASNLKLVFGYLCDLLPRPKSIYGVIIEGKECPVQLLSKKSIKPVAGKNKGKGKMKRTTII